MPRTSAGAAAGQAQQIFDQPVQAIRLVGEVVERLFVRFRCAALRANNAARTTRACCGIENPDSPSDFD